MVRRVTTKAAGNRADTGTPETPAPVRTYVNPNLHVREFKPGYGTNNDDGPASVPEGHARTSPLADELKRASDDGEHALDKLISAGLHDDSRAGIPDINAEQRSVSAVEYPAAHGARRQQEPDARKWGALPESLGAAPDADEMARRNAELKAGQA